ncbi:MAG: sporulation protein Cse60 [Saprospiraceae bacterium]|nr:sporulation protein Cse60 [Saprospiraceae bacterium]
MAIPKVKVFGRNRTSDLEREINEFINRNDIRAEDIITVSYSNTSEIIDHYSALMVYKK